MILTKARISTIYDLVSPPLILVTPFISFIEHNDYSYTAPEFWACVAGLVAIGLLFGAIVPLVGTWWRVVGTAALLTLFVDLQFEWFDALPHLWVPAFWIGLLLPCWLAGEHLSRVVAFVFAIMLVSTVALSAFDGATSSVPASMRAGGEPAAANGPPTIVHIILDEHIGIEGIPVDLQHGRETKVLLKSFFLSHGFRLFGHAYSRYAGTRDSIPNMLNYASRPLSRAWISGDIPVVLRANKYFEDMHQAGYDIHAFQTAFMDLCRPSQRILTTCYTEDHTGIKSLEGSRYPLGDKVSLLYQTYARLSMTNSALDHLNSVVRALAARNGWNWPEWWLAGVGMPAVRAMHLMSILSDEVAHARPGQLFFAHLLVPHYPYIYDASCNERNRADFEPAFDRDPLPPNTMQSRERRYALHFEQIQCLMNKLGETFKKWQEVGVYERLAIIIHGDHGSRIYLHRPEASNVEELLISDYADAFSTLLAVKAPGVEPGYDLRWVAIQDILPWLRSGQPARLISSSEALPYVFLEGDDPGRLVKQPLPRFGDAGHVVNRPNRGLGGRSSTKLSEPGG